MKNALKIIEENKNHKNYKYYKLLFMIVGIKAGVLKDLRNEYLAGNKEYLKRVAREIVPELQQLYFDFYSELKKIRKEFYKPNGFEVKINQIGGIRLRLSYVAEVIEDYLQGKTTEISELMEEPVSGINKTWRSPRTYMDTI